MIQNLAILAVFVFVYSLSSRRVERTPISGALSFMLFGLLFGPQLLCWLHFDVEAEGLKLLAELTLAVVLFSDAAQAKLPALRRAIQIPERLLLIGLPLTILLGTVLGKLVFPEMPWIAAALLAAILAPTDAALGKAVVTREDVPENIRESLNVESGLNDGICVPVIVCLLAAATGSSAHDSALDIGLLFLHELGLAAVVGIVLAISGHAALRFFTRREWVNEDWRRLTVVSLAFACFAIAEIVGASGFIASFAGGLAFGAHGRRHQHKNLIPTEAVGDALSLVTWVVFGAAVVGQALGRFEPLVLLYALLSLTLIRMLPVWLSLTGTNLDAREKLFAGWFGPRGLASIVFAVLVQNEHLTGCEAIPSVVVCTVTFSVVLHGASANPLVAKLKATSMN